MNDMNDTTSTPDEAEGPVVTDDQARGPRPHPAARSTNGTPDRSGGKHEGPAPTAGEAKADAAPEPTGVEADATPPAGEVAAPPTSSSSDGVAADRASTGQEASVDAVPVVPSDEGAVSPRQSASSKRAAEVADSSAPTPPEGRPAVRRTAAEAAANAAATRRAAAASWATPSLSTPTRGIPTPSEGGAFGKPGAREEATAELRLPKAANGVASAPVTAPIAHRVTVPAAIPQPGPASATPPPWNRVPGNDTGPVLVDNRSTDEGVPDDSDGPTAFLRAPRVAPDKHDRPPSASTASPSRSGRARPPRQASLQLKRLDPWSVLKLALVLAVVLFFVWLVAVGVLYGVLDGIGVWDRLNGTYADLVSGEAPSGSPLISAGRVFGIAAVVGAINSLLFAVAVTVGAFVYNVSADLVGGIEVTLSERD